MNTEIVLTSCFLDKLELQSKDLIIRLTGDITLKQASEFSQNLLAMDKRNMDFIPILVQSCGGEIDSLLLIIATMEQCVTPLATINLGGCSSAAAVIFALGSNGHRYMGPNAYLMFHEYSMGCEGKGSDLKAVHTHMTKIDNSINSKLEQHMQLKNNFFNDLGPTDKYMTAKEAKKYGITNHIGYPIFKATASISLSLECKPAKRQEIDDVNKRPYKYRKVISDGILTAQGLIVEEDE